MIFVYDFKKKKIQIPNLGTFSGFEGPPCMGYCRVLISKMTMIYNMDYYYLQNCLQLLVVFTIININNNTCILIAPLESNV